VAALWAELLAIFLVLLVIPATLALEGPTLAAEPTGHRLFAWVAPLSALGSCLLAGWWASRRLDADHVRHSVLTGGAAVVLDVGWLVLLGAPVRVLFVLSELLRIGGGAAGGWIASRRKQGRPARPSGAGYSRVSSGESAEGS